MKGSETTREKTQETPRGLSNQSSLFDASSISTVATPSTQQSQSFIYCANPEFEEKDLKHLYLVLDEHSQVGKAVPSSDIWYDGSPASTQCCTLTPAIVSWICYVQLEFVTERLLVTT